MRSLGGAAIEFETADRMIDARSQTGTAPDEQSAMRYSTRASELDHGRHRVPPSPLHDAMHTPLPPWAKLRLTTELAARLLHNRTLPDSLRSAAAPVLL